MARAFFLVACAASCVSAAPWSMWFKKADAETNSSSSPDTLVNATYSSSSSDALVDATFSSSSEQNASDSSTDFFELLSANFHDPRDLNLGSSTTEFLLSAPEEEASKSDVSSLMDAVVDWVGLGLIDVQQTTPDEEVSLEVKRTDASDVYTLRVYHGA